MHVKYKNFALSYDSITSSQTIVESSIMLAKYFNNYM